eukprot:SAG22_NODE_20584_length_264_cov_0.933333_1_plen_61_part_10
MPRKIASSWDRAYVREGATFVVVSCSHPGVLRDLRAYKVVVRRQEQRAAASLSLARCMHAR